MNFFRPTLLCGLSILGLAGCSNSNYTEDARFDENGSGRLHFTFEREHQNILTKWASQWKWDNPAEQKKKLERNLPDGLRLIEFKKIDHDERVTFKGTFAFDHFNNFSKWVGGDEVRQLFDITLERKENLWIFERRIRPRDADQSAEAKANSVNSKVTLKVTGPGKLKSHNADKVELENTCVWEGSIPDLLNGKDGEGTVMRAEFDVSKGIGKTPYIVIGAVLALILAAVVRGRMRKNPN